jgi:type IV secretion system protein VirB7
MIPRTFLLLLALFVTGCASVAPTALPVCDGKHLRPANPNGSVLGQAPATAPAPATPPSHLSAQPGCGA